MVKFRLPGVHEMLPIDFDDDDDGYIDCITAQCKSHGWLSTAPTDDIPRAGGGDGLDSKTRLKAKLRSHNQ